MSAALSTSTNSSICGTTYGWRRMSVTPGPKPRAHPPRPSGVLSNYQQEVARLLADVPEAAGFALAGGAALTVTGIVERETDDLDFFGREATAVNRLAPAFERAAQRAGMTVARIVDAPGMFDSSWRAARTAARLISATTPGCGQSNRPLLVRPLGTRSWRPTRPSRCSEGPPLETS